MATIEIFLANSFVCYTIFITIDLVVVNLFTAVTLLFCVES